MMRRLPPFDYDILHGLVGRHGLQNVLNALADISREMQWLNTAAVLDETAMEVPPKHEARRKPRRKAVARIVLTTVATMLAMPAQAQYTYPFPYTPEQPGFRTQTVGPLQGYPYPVIAPPQLPATTAVPPQAPGCISSRGCSNSGGFYVPRVYRRR